jgi:hypothetical protein
MIEGVFQWIIIRASKSEIRNSKSETNPKFK